MTTKTPRPPAGLEARGRAFWRSVQTAYELGLDESELLTEVCRLLDLCEQLADTDPAGAALNRARGMLGRLVAQLSLPGSDVVTTTTARARKANAARWSQPASGSSVSDAARRAASARWHAS